MSWVPVGKSYKVTKPKRKKGWFYHPVNGYCATDGATVYCCYTKIKFEDGSVSSDFYYSESLDLLLKEAHFCGKFWTTPLAERKYLKS